MKIKIIQDKNSMEFECEKFEVDAKFFRLINVTYLDLTKTKVKEKCFKLASVVSYEILE